MNAGNDRILSEALYAALRDNPFYIALSDSIPTRINAHDRVLRYLDYSIAEARRFGRLFAPQGRPVGASVWSLPLQPEQMTRKAQDKAAFIQSELGADACRVYSEMSVAMAERTNSLIEESDWYLSILGVLPEHQGKGLGRDLVRPVLEEADRIPVASYLETFSPRNMSFYSRLGYQTTGTFTEPVTGEDYWVMRRLPPVCAAADG